MVMMASSALRVMVRSPSWTSEPSSRIGCCVGAYNAGNLRLVTGSSPWCSGGILLVVSTAKASRVMEVPSLMKGRTSAIRPNARPALWDATFCHGQLSDLQVRIMGVGKGVRQHGELCWINVDFCRSCLPAFGLLV